MLRASLRLRNTTQPFLLLPQARRNWFYNYYPDTTEQMETTQRVEQSEQGDQVQINSGENSNAPDQPPRNYTILSRTSKTISYILRHGALKEGLQMRPDGYVKVDDLVRLYTSKQFYHLICFPQLRLPKLGSVGFLELEHIVKQDLKKRYNLLLEAAPTTWRGGSEIAMGPVWWIRANQGHSLQVCYARSYPSEKLTSCRPSKSR